MKRTRRVEVTRYTLRSTVIGDEAPLGADALAEQAALDVLLGTPSTHEVLGNASERNNQKVRDVEGSDITLRRRPLRFLKRLIKG